MAAKLALIGHQIIANRANCCATFRIASDDRDAAGTYQFLTRSAQSGEIIAVACHHGLIDGCQAGVQIRGLNYAILIGEHADIAGAPAMRSEEELMAHITAIASRYYRRAIAGIAHQCHITRSSDMVARSGGKPCGFPVLIPL